MLERERKFLVNEKFNELKDSLPSPPIIIRQGYLMLGEDRHLRIRIIKIDEDGRGYAELCYKTFISETDRNEFEYIIPFNQGMQMWQDALYTIIKHRYTLEHENSEVSVDVYSNGLITAEIEYSDECPFPITLPEYFGPEITGQQEYSNISLAKQGI